MTGNCIKCCNNTYLINKEEGEGCRFTCDSNNPDNLCEGQIGVYTDNICGTDNEVPEDEVPEVTLCTKDGDDPFMTGNCIKCCNNTYLINKEEGDGCRFTCDSNNPDNLCEGQTGVYTDNIC